ERNPVAAGVANHRREIVVAIVDCIRKECLLRGTVDERRALGEAVEGSLVLGTHQTPWAGLLDYAVNSLQKGLTQLFFVGILHAHIEGIEALLPQLPHAFVAVAGGRAPTVEPNAVQFVLGHKLSNEVEFPFQELLPADAKLPQISPISLIFSGRTARLSAVLGGAGGVGLHRIRECFLRVGDLLRLWAGPVPPP